MHPWHAHGGIQHPICSNISYDAAEQHVKRQMTQELSSTMAMLAPQSISFLKLAAEIRNQIYSLVVAHDSTIFVDEKNPGKVKSASSVARLNRQVREEYMSLLNKNSPNLYAVVRDFDFSHVIAFYDHLQDSAPEELYEQTDTLTTKSLTIVLVFSRDYSIKRSKLLSNEWFRWQNHPSLRGVLGGTEVAVKYIANNTSQKRRKHLDTWIKTCDKTRQLQGFTWKRSELKKIRKAITWEGHLDSS